jgi:hypothetical protein
VVSTVWGPRVGHLCQLSPSSEVPWKPRVVTANTGFLDGSCSKSGEIRG